MNDLVAFLRARLDEDEGERWNVHSGDCRSAGPLQLSCDCGYPERALREVEAKRALLDAFNEACEHPYDLPEGVHDGRDDDERELDAAVLDVLEHAARHLAAVYSGHPDYRQEWAP